ncbi:acyl dehydratase [Intrasporangium calvum]|uniref:MaoC like domain-containing protein n=1 Tax=Intrasporangium calvum (strain ATCC 23552 / DSM 43043 / JCM 3097 / NBRC 12989 / NCIMB 10167 / NRRL B-3866 / 7 KIP) TaxID=710696 RepID=E6SCM1_INTC7|nr:acyl dehydratase [Intrasporangium calvum]ADU49625.1 MaoC like domain-containing protein [Intrasporangium calvum DSM 43043]
MLDIQTLFAGEVTVGTELPEVVWEPTHVQLFRFSAITWNAHRIHYDQAYAAEEGYPDVLVQSHLHGCFLVQTVMSWAGPRATLHRFRWQNRHLATPGDKLRCTGTVTAVEGSLVHCELREINQHGDICAPGWATVELPVKDLS